MTKKLDNLNMDEKKLEALLDIFGADLSKYPEPFAEDIKNYLDHVTEDNQNVSKETKLKVTELRANAEFIDQALDFQRPLPKWDLAAIEDKILEKAFKGKEEKSADVIQLEDRKSKTKITHKSKTDFGKNDLFTVKSTGLIAASLLAGLLIGSLGGGEFLLVDESTTLLASNGFIDDVLFLGTEYSIDNAEFLRN